MQHDALVGEWYRLILLLVKHFDEAVQVAKRCDFMDEENMVGPF